MLLTPLLSARLPLPLLRRGPPVVAVLAAALLLAACRARLPKLPLAPLLLAPLLL